MTRETSVQLRVTSTEEARPALRAIAPPPGCHANLPPCCAVAQQRGPWRTRCVSQERLQPKYFATGASRSPLVVHQLVLGSRSIRLACFLFERYMLTILSAQTKSSCVCVSDPAVRGCECISSLPSRIGGLLQGRPLWGHFLYLCSKQHLIVLSYCAVLSASQIQSSLAAHMGGAMATHEQLNWNEIKTTTCRTKGFLAMAGWHTGL